MVPAPLGTYFVCAPCLAKLIPVQDRGYRALGVVVLQSRIRPMDQFPVSSHDNLVPEILNRRIDDRIRKLSEKALEAAPEARELESIRQELLCLVHEKMNRIRNMAARHLVDGNFIGDRRVHRD